MNNDAQKQRFSRQLILKNFGEKAQEKLLQSRILVIGAGGLGCPALQYLVAAGVGTVGIIDDDRVALSNLHRQTLYTTAEVGLSKAITAAQRLHEMNPDCRVIPFNERLTTANALELFEQFDVIVDGSDNFATRYLVNDACVLLNKPLVYAAVSQYEGQLAVFNFTMNDETPVNYRDLFPEPPKNNEILNCAEGGVLGVLPGIIGTMQAAEAIKIIAGIGRALVNTLLTFNVLNFQSYEVAIQSREETRKLIPADAGTFRQMNYEWMCTPVISPLEIDFNTFDHLVSEGNTHIIDVRELHETPAITEFRHDRIPTSVFKEQQFVSAGFDTIVVFCQSGKRSLEIATYLSAPPYSFRRVFSLRGGIAAWKQQQQNKQTV
jgi:sulfur-carrier protein adenylyltransferase/sulfurtransferase